MNTFSIIIPVKPGGHVAASEHLRNIMPDDSRYEILLAEGRAPSQQRNLAACEACGDILYFLDDDSLLLAENFTRCAAAMADLSVAVVGGPSITPIGDTWLQQLFGYALASSFGSGAVHNRYRTFGTIRSTSDKELILCNLAVSRAVFELLGGFDERLYPNEENEFMDRVSSAGYTILHDPEMLVFRSQRRSVKAFASQMFNYGRGRGQQTRITSSYSMTSFIPLLFVIYLLLSIAFIKSNILLLVPLMLYLSAALVNALLTLFRTGRLFTLLLFMVYPLMHIANGVGLLWGLVNGIPDRNHDSSIRISKIKQMGEPFPVSS